MTHIQTQFNFTSISSERQFTTLPRIDANTNREAVDLLKSLADFFSSLSQIMPESPTEPGRCRTVSPPVREDGCHPSGGLKVDQESGVITTPGGYKIEQIGQYEWKITGEDGKWTRVWGDPHVQESDRSGDATAWDFKRDSTFLLPDGTRINVSTKPYNNMTVTSGLEVTNGNDRVLVTDIDKGKGKVGDVTHDGFQNIQARADKDVFVMGKETDDWYLNGQEVLGSNNGGESFKLGQGRNQDMGQFLNQVQGFALRLMNSLFQNWPTGRGREADQSRDRICDQINTLNQLFRTVAELRNLDTRVTSGRFSFQA
jgi:hypothetical protein